jgi:SecD/SecF fusion protein
MPAQAEDYIFAYVEPKNKSRVASLLLNKEPVFVQSIRKKVKFLFGKEINGKIPLYAVVVTSEHKAPLDGSCITEAVARQGHSQGNFAVSFQMNNEGALIWERLTAHAYQTRSNIAIVIDDLVYSAPFVTAGPIKGGKCEISGNFTRSEAIMLASVIHSGALPKMKTLEIKSVE